MIFFIDMDKADFLALREEIEGTESSVLMDFYSKLLDSAKKEAEIQKKESEEILGISVFDDDVPKQNEVRNYAHDKIIGG